MYAAGYTTFLNDMILNFDDDNFFLWYGWPKKGIEPYFQLKPLSEIFTIANLWNVPSMVWICAEP